MHSMESVLNCKLFLNATFHINKLNDNESNQVGVAYVSNANISMQSMIRRREYENDAINKDIPV